MKRPGGILAAAVLAISGAAPCGAAPSAAPGAAPGDYARQGPRERSYTLPAASRATRALRPALGAPLIEAAQARRIGRRIWRNESGGAVSGLTSWNEGEEFASLGIAHFIWFPRGFGGPFRESFPMMIDYLAAHGVVLPEWLQVSPECPWSSREEFLAARDSPRMRELRRLLERTVDLQAFFAADRLRAAVPGLLRKAPARLRLRVRRQFERVWRAPGGIYALVDYVNFKGEGLLPKERYGGRGWGLLQVLEGMRGEEEGPAALRDFAASARVVLARRVRRSPPGRREGRWLKGWFSRLRTYRDA